MTVNATTTSAGEALPADIGERGELVPNTAGITGGVRVWALDPENN